jgi:poly-gamma-glutamate synthesis protein (capsule biosynthesis protein)
LKELGVKCCGLSNNHVFDYGKKGIYDMVAALEKNGIDYTGFGNDYEDSRKNYIIEKDGEKIALIAVCEHEYSYAFEGRMGSRPYDEYDTIEDVRNAKAECDRVIVIYHGGKEFCRYPSPRLRKLCRALVKNGADVVLCQHSHCIGSYENFNGSHILYGQGNFHFVKDHDFIGWHTSLVVNYDSKTNEIEFSPLKSTEYGIALPTKEEGAQLMMEFYARNEEVSNGKWLDGWKAFCQEMKPIYHQCIAKAFAPGSTPREDGKFSHFLDCEAHTDVWRELYPSLNYTNCIDEE